MAEKILPFPAGVNFENREALPRDIASATKSRCQDYDF
jgi:hypothetical protein